MGMTKNHDSDEDSNTSRVIGNASNNNNDQKMEKSLRLNPNNIANMLILTHLINLQEIGYFWYSSRDVLNSALCSAVVFWKDI